MTDAVICMAGVAKRFGKNAVIDGLDWEIPAGQVVGLLGRNGEGKSTLLACMLGLVETDAGTVSIYGEDVGHLSNETRARIGYVPQQLDLFDWMTPAQMLRYVKALYPRWNEDKVNALLARWGFNSTLLATPIYRLSGGEKQRLAIVRAIGHEPDLLVLDEPVSALDPLGRRDFLRELIDRVVDRETTVVFSTHILSDLERVAVNVAFLKDGHIVRTGPLDELLEDARSTSGRQLGLEDMFIEVTQ